MDRAGQPNLYERYASIRRPVEIAGWITIMALQAALGSMVALVDARQTAHPPATWQVWTWELSSHAVMLLLVPAVAAVEARFPLRGGTAWARLLAAHLGASIVFSLLHVAGMVGLRQAVYALTGQHYDFAGANGGWMAAWGYEYLKDVRTYALFAGGIALYRFVLLRLQGEARLLDPPEAPGPSGVPVAADGADAIAAPRPDVGAGPSRTPTGVTVPLASTPAPSRPERFLVRKLRREFLIAATDIDALQAQGNYVGLRVRGHDYLLRSTLADFLTQLDPARFVRVHRSHAVNLDRIREIEPTDAGDARLHLHDGSTIPCSRRYRDALTGAVPGGTTTATEGPTATIPNPSSGAAPWPTTPTSSGS